MIFPYQFAARALLIALLLVAGYLFSGFLVPVLAALIVGFASWPAYLRLRQLCGGSATLAATIAILLILLVLIIPLLLALTFAVDEVREWVNWLVVANREGVSAPLWIGELPGFGPWLTAQWDQHLAEPQSLSHILGLVNGQQIGNISRWLLSISAAVFNLLLATLFMLIALFFIYRDGENLSRQLDVLGERVVPLRWQRFSRVVPATVSATVLGMVVIAIGEGVVLGVAYWLAGVPSPFALGVMTGLMAMVPGGAPLAFTLVSLYLVGTGDAFAASALFVWGSVELFIVDKTLRPRLVGGPVSLPFLPTFFGLVGGVTTMGLVGLFVGPVIMALCVALWREWIYAARQSDPGEFSAAGT